jgi:hypothetical protein
MDIYLYNPWMLLDEVLMLTALVYACLRIRRHLGPSLCVIIATVLDLSGLLAWVVLVRVIHLDYASMAFGLLEHFRSAIWLLSFILLYVAIFGWRGKKEGTGYAAAIPGSPRHPLLESIRAVHIPPAWVMTVTVLMLPIFLLSTAWTLAIVFSEGNSEAFPALVIWGLTAFAAIVTGTVLVVKILYRAWTAIQDGQARTTPGRAVGGLFIPIYNFYWFFVAWNGLAKDFNAFLSRHQIPTRRLPEGLFLTYCILVVVGVVVNYVPILGTLYGIGEMVIGLAVLWSITGRVNELHAHLMSAPRMASG